MSSAKTISSFTGDYAFLSNFYIHPFKYQNIKFPSAEHAFHAHKSTDKVVHEAFARVRLPGDAKRKGRGLILREDWEGVKQGVMLEILCAKFSDNGLAKKLLATGDALLVEGNTWGDTYWGVCRGEGQNVLGTLLMAVRYLVR